MCGSLNIDDLDLEEMRMSWCDICLRDRQSAPRGSTLSAVLRLLTQNSRRLCYAARNAYGEVLVGQKWPDNT